jgi:hypothetical protein
MADLTNPSNAYALFSPGGANGDTFSGQALWQEATKYLYMVCLPGCNTNFATINSTQADQIRDYVYSPDMDDPLYNVWQALLTGTTTAGTVITGNAAVTGFKNTLVSSFTFRALPSSVCPYDPSFCVPFPGIEFSQLSSSNYCTIEMAAEVISAIGTGAADALQSMGISDFASGATEEFGDWVGDFITVLDSFILTALCAFVIGLIFLILLRFFIGCCVWIAIIATVVIFIIAGALTMVRSYQCSGAGIFETGQQSAVAISATAANAASTGLGITEEASEDISGDGADYRGVQTVSKMGHQCQDWESQNTMPQYRAAYYPTTLTNANNYCRNPYNASDANKASTIWCITGSSDVFWEECMPIGVIQPECSNGYAVASESMRQILFYAAFVVWAVGLIWVIVILCFAGRIQLAVALNKVGALFLGHNPSITLVPVVQAFLGIMWVLAWCFGVAF